MAVGLVDGTTRIHADLHAHMLVGQAGQRQRQVRDDIEEVDHPVAAVDQRAKESGTGSARDPELVALEEVIAQINDLFSGDHPDSSVRNVVTHIKDRLEESETLQQQAQNNSLAQFSASPDLHNEFVGAVIGAMDSSEDLSTQILNNSEISQKLLGELVPIIYRALKETA